MAKIKCPYTFPHKSRKARAEYLEGIGGYSRYLDGKWPIEFTVACYDTDFSFDNIWDKYSSEHTPAECFCTPDLMAAYYNLAKRLHKSHEEYMWAWGQEDAARSISDDDTFRQLWDGTPVSVELQLRGRSGKHLVIAEFEGRNFTGMDGRDLHDEIMCQVRPDGYEHVEYNTLRKGNVWNSWTDAEVEKLYKYVRMCEQDFTTAKASKEVEYQGAFCFFANIVASEWEVVKQEMASHEEAVEAAQALYSALSGEDTQKAVFDSLYVLCSAAGVSQEEAQS